MNDKFIYVFNEQDSKELSLLGYTLLKRDDENKVYIFANDGIARFSNSDVVFVMSDKMTF